MGRDKNKIVERSRTAIPTLSPNFPRLARLDIFERKQQGWDQRQEVNKAVALGAKHKHAKWTTGQILLKSQTFINGDKRIVLASHGVQQAGVRQLRPSDISHALYVVSDDMIAKTLGYAVVQQNPQ